MLVALTAVYVGKPFLVAWGSLAVTKEERNRDDDT